MTRSEHGDAPPDATWNVITGCSAVSAGCLRCDAMRLSGTRLRHHPSRAGLTRDGEAGPVWTGEVRFNEAWLDRPLRWRRPRMIRVCAHGDLFAEAVPERWIDRVFAVMALAPHHTFQVLTKRSARMRAYLGDRGLGGRIMDELGHAARAHAGARALADGLRDLLVVQRRPLPNVWLGVSAEDQGRANERILDLLATPAALRWISAEPLLGPVDLRALRIAAHLDLDALTGAVSASARLDGGADFRTGLAALPLLPEGRQGLDWVVVGGETGPGSRPMHPDWARALRDQCAAAGVAFRFHQHGDGSVGGGPPEPDGGLAEGGRTGGRAARRLLDGRSWAEVPDGRRPPETRRGEAARG